MEARLAGEILGMTLMTHQTNPHGRVVSKVLVEAALEIEKELYLGIVPDRTSATLGGHLQDLKPPHRFVRLKLQLFSAPDAKVSTTI